MFLRSNSTSYTFFDPMWDNGKLAVIPELVPYEAGDSPSDRLLKEMVTTAKFGTGLAQVRAVEELGHLQDSRASSLLRTLSVCPDVALKGRALIARIQIGDAPSVEELLSFLQISPCDFNEMASGKKYGTDAYSVPHLQIWILNAILCSVEAPHMKRLTDFDYQRFCRAAMEFEISDACGGAFRNRFSPRKGFAREWMLETLNHVPTDKPHQRQ